MSRHLFKRAQTLKRGSVSRKNAVLRTCPSRLPSPKKIFPIFSKFDNSSLQSNEVFVYLQRRIEKGWKHFTERTAIWLNIQMLLYDAT